MSDPRWTDETRRVVLRLMVEYAPYRPDTATDRVLAALADAGLLVPPGGETHTEWASLDHGEPIPWENQEAAERNAEWLRETDLNATVMFRTVYHGPWQPSEATPTGGNASPEGALSRGA